MDKIFITDLQVEGILGVNPEERIQTQPIVVNVVLFVDTRLSAETQKINDTVSYSAVAKRIRRHIVASSDFLIEKLINDLAQVILTEFAVERVILRVEKPQAVAAARTVGVEIDRTAPAP
ncbi:MAG: dihydroneopterin aldolase [Anaerolineae bacterium]|nr:dihydroneopterin aldolase [Anaerolineae bacterium]MCO5192440.1 dihydroneopterin aldolase [Anaerolineae bacterium]